MEHGVPPLDVYNTACTALTPNTYLVCLASERLLTTRLSAIANLVINVLSIEFWNENVE